jgi:hypothetical protein
MAPAFDGNTDSVPRSDGSPYAPSNTFNIFWADYEIAPNLKVVYWQRMLVFLNSNPQFQGVQFLPRDPRFALRFTQVFNVPDLTTTYDVFFQLPFTDNVLSNRNNIELGFRTNTSYAFPKSHWSIGLVQEFTTAYFGGRGGARAFGWAMPWASYELTKTFSTQTALSFPFQNRRSNPSWTEFVWDDPGSAYIQNGIGINVTNQVWMAVFLNNYLFAPVSLNNTWASLWLSLTIL